MGPLSRLQGGGHVDPPQSSHDFRLDQTFFCLKLTFPVSQECMRDDLLCAIVIRGGLGYRWLVSPLCALELSRGGGWAIWGTIFFLLFSY